MCKYVHHCLCESSRTTRIMDLVFVQISLIHWCEFKFNFGLKRWETHSVASTNPKSQPTDNFIIPNFFPFSSLSPTQLSIFSSSEWQIYIVFVRCVWPPKYDKRQIFYRKRLLLGPIVNDDQSLAAILMKLNKNQSLILRMKINCLVQKAIIVLHAVRFVWSNMVCDLSIDALIERYTHYGINKGTLTVLDRMIDII